MRIIKLIANNYKALRAVSLNCPPHTVEIRGKNGAGKSAVLEAIKAAVGGKRKMLEVPIRNGASKAEVEVDFGTFKVRRTISGGSSQLTATAADGTAIKSPQELLTRMFGLGDAAFNCTEFLRGTRSAQRETLIDILGIRQDLAAIDAELQHAVDERRLAKLKLKDAQAECKIEMPAELRSVDMSEEIDVDEIDGQLATASSVARERGHMESTLASLELVVAENRDRANELRREASRLDTAASHAASRIIEIKDRMAAIPDVDFESLQSLRNRAELQRRKRAFLDAHKQRYDRLEMFEADVDIAEHKVANYHDERQRILASAKWPVEGLEFGEDGLIYAGIPLEQCSTSERIRVCARLAMAHNPEARVLFIEDGALLDKNSLAELDRLAVDEDFQVFIEVAGDADSERPCVVIDDGQVIMDTTGEVN